MKYYKLFLSLLFAFVFLLGTSSISVNAEEYTDFRLTSTISWKVNGSNNWTMNVTHPADSSSSSGTHTQSFALANYYQSDFNIENADGSIIAARGKNITVDASNIYRMFTISGVGNYTWQAVDSIQLITCHTDNTYGYYDNVEFSYSSAALMSAYHAELTTEKDVRKIIIRTTYNPTNRLGITYSNIEVITYADSVVAHPSPRVSIQSEEAGLLSGLINWVTQIFEKVKTMAADVASGFANVVKGITELPAKLWSLIEEGLKNLFVPDEEFMAAYSDLWDLVLSTRFGAIYESAQMIFDFWDSIEMSDETQSVDFPLVSLEGSGIPFSFGGFSVRVVPQGFEFLANSCKVITSILCTFLFVNGMRKRYDEVMGVES